MKNNDDGWKAFILFWVVIIALAAIVIGLNEITQSDYGLAILFVPIIAIIAFVAYRDYRRNLNKKEREALQQNISYEKPKKRDDFKIGISILVIVLIIGALISLVWSVLYILGIAEQNPKNI